MISPNYSKEKRYFLMPGEVISKTDGDRHFISASELAQLYGVPYHAYNVVTIRSEERNHARIWEPGRDIFLHPDPSGEYKLPTKNVVQ